MYSDLVFSVLSCNPLKISEKVVHRPYFSKDSLITPSRGWQRLAEGDMIKWYTLRVQMKLFLNRSCDYIQDVTLFCNSTHTQKMKTTPVYYFHIMHLCKQIMNQTKQLLQLLLTCYSLDKYYYVAKSIGHLSPFMPPLAVCQLKTS